MMYIYIYVIYIYNAQNDDSLNCPARNISVSRFLSEVARKQYRKAKFEDVKHLHFIQAGVP